MTELDKNVLKEIEDNRKVEVVVKRDAAAEGTELDLVRVFQNMGKKKRIYAWLLIFCMLIGLATPLLMAELSEKYENVSAVISFLYPRAKDGYAPDNTKLDINYITSSYILQSAMDRTHLSKDIPVSALERNISIESMLTEETRQNLEVVEKVINETSKDYGEVLNVDYQYEGKYIITLKNGFSIDPDARTKTFLDGAEMAALLNCIVDNYNLYFYDTYLSKDLPENDMDAVSNTNMDYIEREEELKQLVDRINADPKMQGLLLRRIVGGYPHISSGQFTFENVEQVVEHLVDTPAWDIDGDEDYQVIGVPRKLFDQVVDMIQAYGLILKAQEGDK